MVSKAPKTTQAASLTDTTFPTEWPSGMKWAQHQGQVLLSINVQDMKYYRVQLAEKNLFFLGVSKDGAKIFEINNARLAGLVNTKKSGQKLSTQKWLNIYLRKVLLNPIESDPRRKLEPIVDPATGQKFPPPPRQMPNFGKFWKTVFDEKSDPKLAELNRKIKVDWDRWQDEDQDKDM